MNLRATPLGVGSSAWGLALAWALAGGLGLPQLAAWASAAWMSAALLALSALGVALLPPRRVVPVLGVGLPVLAMGLWLAVPSEAWRGPALLLLWVPALLGWAWAALSVFGLAALPGSALLPAGLGFGLLGWGLCGYAFALAGSMAAALLLPTALGWGLLWLLRRGLAVRAAALRQGLQARLASPVDRALAGALLGSALVLAYACLTPTLGWDALSTHLAVPGSWIAAGRVYNSPYIANPTLPPLAFSLNLQALLFGCEQAGRVLHWLSVLGTALAAAHVARGFGTRAMLWAALLVCGMPLAVVLLYDGMIDFHQALLVWAGLAVLLAGGGARAFLGGGLLLGGAMLVKPQAGLYAGMLLPVLLLERRRSLAARGTWTAAAACTLGLALGSGAWWLRELLSEGRILALTQAANALDGGAADFMMLKPPGHGPRELWTFAYRVSLLPTRFGPVFLALAPAGLLLLLRPAWRLLLWGVLCFAASFYVTSVDRWFLPLLPLAAAAAAVALAGRDAGARPLLPAWARAGLLPGLLLQAVLLLGNTLGPANLAAPLGYLSGRQDRAAWYAAHVDAWPAMQAAEAVLPPGGRVALYGESRSFLLRAPSLLADPVWACPGFDYRHVSGVADLAAECRRAGVTHRLFTYRAPRSPADHPLRLRFDPLWAALEARGKPVIDRNGVRLTDLRPALASPAAFR